MDTDYQRACKKNKEDNEQPLLKKSFYEYEINNLKMREYISCQHLPEVCQNDSINISEVSAQLSSCDDSWLG